MPNSRDCNTSHSLWFGNALRRAFAQKYGRDCTASLLALKFNTEVAGLERGISVETARRWLRGLSFPEPKRMSAIIEWLEMKSLNTHVPSAGDGSSNLTSGGSHHLPADESLTIRISADDAERLRKVLLPLLTRNVAK